MVVPLVSVIIPTRNRPQETLECVQSVLAQNYNNIEIIVVDGNSTDNTRDTVAPFVNQVIVYPKQGDHRCAQRNLGVKNAKGEFVLIIDSDMTLSPNVVACCVEKMNDVKIKSVIIPEESYGEGFWAQCKKLEKSFYIGVDAVEAARFFRKSDFESINGYNEALTSGEDWDLSDRIEILGPLARIDDLIFHNEGRISLLQTLKKKYYYAQKAQAYMAHTKNVPTAKKRKVGVIGRYGIYLRQPSKLLSHPVCGLGMLWMKTCEFGVGAIGLMFKVTQNNNTENNIAVFRNCFTGQISGGDTHMSEVLYILSKNADCKIYLFRPEKDGQELSYKDVAHITNFTYKNPLLHSRYVSLDFIFRAILGSVSTHKLPYNKNVNNIYISSSHFIPDIIPVTIKSLFLSKSTRVVYIHHLVSMMSRKSNFSNKLALLQEKICLYIIKKCYHKIVTVNSLTKDYLIKSGYSHLDIIVVGNPINTINNNYRTFLKNKETDITFCGRLVEQKGIYDFIEIITKLVKQFPNLKVKIIGTGPEELKIKTIIKNKELPIEILGHVSDEIKYKILADSKYFLFPSREEGWGIVIAESMSVGTPVIALDLDVYSEIFGKNIYKAKNTIDLYNMTQNLLESLDEEEYSNLQTEIITYTKNFDIEKISNIEYEFFKN